GSPAARRVTSPRSCLTSCRTPWRRPRREPNSSTSTSSFPGAPRAPRPRPGRGDRLASAPEEAEQFDLDEFIRRVAQRAQVAPGDARSGVSAVFQTVEEAVSFGEFDDVMAQLPDEFGALAKPIILP